MRACVINIGNELLQGQVVNGNGAFLAAELKALGAEVVGIYCIADGFEPLAQILLDLKERVDVYVFTGGLGPTPDDTTRYDFAQALGLEMEYHPEIEAAIVERCLQMGRPYREQNKVQAYFPRQTKILANEFGTAAGFAYQDAQRHFFFLPGVPYEMGPMFQNEVRPLLPLEKSAWHRRELVSYGLGEDLQTQLLEGVEFPAPLLFASLPSPDGLLLRVSAQGDHVDELENLVQAKFDEILSLLKGHEEKIVSYDGKKIPERVVELLLAYGQKVAVAESLTGGGLGAAITRVPGASQVFCGGWVVYQDEMKEKFLDVPREVLESEGAVSAAVVEQMARAAQDKSGADWALSLSGLAGPGGDRRNPVGTVWVGLATPQGQVRSVKLLWKGSREQIRQRAGFLALNELRKAIQKQQ